MLGVEEAIVSDVKCQEFVLKSKIGNENTWTFCGKRVRVKDMDPLIHYINIIDTHINQVYNESGNCSSSTPRQL